MLKKHQFGDWMTRHTHFVDRMWIRVEMNTQHHFMFDNANSTRLSTFASDSMEGNDRDGVEPTTKLNLLLDSTYSYTNQGQSTKFIAS